jgi:hypothetical protein
MVKLTVAVLLVALAGTASAGGWRSLRLDARNESEFTESVALFQDKLSPSRRHAFDRALQAIWLQGTREASDAQREFTPSDYFTQLDGLTYEEIVTLLDPTGDSAKRYRAEYYATRGTPWSGNATAWSQQGYPPPVQNGTYRGSPIPNTADSRAACQCMFPDNAAQ